MLRANSGRFVSMAVAGLILGCSMSGCAVKPDYIRKPFHPAKRVVVLPLANETNDMKAAHRVRHLLRRGLQRKGYQVLPLNQTDARLRKLGITQGGQLRSRRPKEVAKLFGQSVCLYGRMIDATNVTLGVVMKRKVKVEAKLVDREGVMLWKHTAAAGRSKLELNKKKMKRALKRQLAKKLIGSIISHPLQREMKKCVDHILKTLPRP